MPPEIHYVWPPYVQTSTTISELKVFANNIFKLSTVNSLDLNCVLRSLSGFVAKTRVKFIDSNHKYFTCEMTLNEKEALDKTVDDDMRVSLEYSGKQISRVKTNSFIVTKDFYLMAASHT
jgi:hypothetical protein